MEEADNRPATRTRKPWVAWTLVALGAIERVVGWGGSIDFVLARWNEPAWVATLMSGLLNLSNIIGLLLLLGGIALLIRHERRRNDGLYGPLKEQMENAPSFVDQFNNALAEMPPLTEAPAGVTLTATATVRDPTTKEILERSLYVGQVIGDVSQLSEDNLVTLTIRGFNGANRIIRVVEAVGHVVANYKGEDGKPQSLELPAPTLVRNGQEPENIDKFAEFHTSIRQHLTPAQAKALSGALENEGVSLDLDELHIRAASINELGEHVRIPLWNGINLFMQEGLQTGRVVKLQAEAATISLGSGGEPR